MVAADEIHIRVTGRTGRITLTRPEALNALTHNMALAIEQALDDWSSNGEVDLILVDAEGEKAFCAGGDIADLYDHGRAGDEDFGRRFWTDEYRMNAKIANCTVPYVAIMDGIVMGGGVGISAHGSHRIVTERSMIAMPECGIGLIPDVGGTWLLAQAPGHLGEFLGMTGWRMNGADAVLAGFADRVVASEAISAVVQGLEENGDTNTLESFPVPRLDAALGPHLEAIDRHFGKETALDCLLSLESDTSEFAGKAAQMIRKASPLSVGCTFEMVRRARGFSRIEQALQQELRFTWRVQSEGEFLEGIRAQIIEKDRNPKWKAAGIEEVSGAQVQSMLAPLGEHELFLQREENT